MSKRTADLIVHVEAYEADIEDWNLVQRQEEASLGRDTSLRLVTEIDPDPTNWDATMLNIALDNDLAQITVEPVR
jgi:hypothetical protein